VVRGGREGGEEVCIIEETLYIGLDEWGERKMGWRLGSDSYSNSMK